MPADLIKVEELAINIVPIYAVNFRCNHKPWALVGNCLMWSASAVGRFKCEEQRNFDAVWSSILDFSLLDHDLACQ
jgi:hypothetical protein